jgi:PAS domain S-box-containing protein
MNHQNYSVLLVEDDRVDQLAFKRYIDREGLRYNYEIVSSFREAKKLLTSKHFDVVITDYFLGDGTAFDVFKHVSNSSVIITTGTGDEEIAVKAMKSGAYDYLIKDPDRKYLTMLPITVENALKQKKAVEHQKRLQLLESAVLHAFDAVIICQCHSANIEDTKIVFTNEAFTKMTGFSEVEVTGNSIDVLFGAKTDSMVINNIESALRKKEQITSEIVYYKKDGSQFWAEFSLQPVSNGKNNINHWVYVQRDISERKTAEEEMRQYNERLDIILQSMGDGVLVLDADQKIMMINNKAKELLCDGTNDVAKMRIKDVINECSKEGENLIQSLKKNSFANLEFQVTSPRSRLLLVTGTSFLDVDGESAGKVLILRDYTKEKEIEQMKNDFVSNVSHELRTPLASILGFSSTILKDNDMPDEVKSEFNEIIYRESRRLAQLIDDILSISRIESGRQLYYPKKMSLRTIVPEIMDTFKIQAQEKRIEMINNINGKLSPILIDQKAIRQVLVNLIGNAIKFTERNGTVTIDAQNIKKSVVLEIKDTGIGIPQADISKIFDKFFRVNQIGASIAGTGLGLSIVREIVDYHNGEIDVLSEEKKGTTFRVTFPKFKESK